MLTLLKLVVLAELASLLGVTTALDHTWIFNDLAVPVIASISYTGGKSKFTNRKIEARGKDVDEYNLLFDQGYLHVEVKGPDGCHAESDGNSDESVRVEKLYISQDHGDTKQGFHLQGNYRPHSQAIDVMAKC